MSNLKLSDDTNFQNVFNSNKSNKPLEKRIASSYLKGKGVKTLLDNMPTPSTTLDFKSTANKISAVTIGGYEITQTDKPSISFKHKVKHRVKMLLNLKGYKDDFNAKVVALADAYRNDEGIARNSAIKAVSENSGALKNYPQFQNDREIVLAAVQKNGPSLQYASDDLKNDPDVVLEAIKNHKMALFHASKECRENSELRKAAGWPPDFLPSK